MLSVLHNPLALHSRCKHSMHLFSALSTGISKLKPQIGCLIRKHKIHFLWNGSISLQLIYRIPVPDTQGLYHHSPKSQVHKHTPAVFYCSTNSSPGKLHLYIVTGYPPGVTNTGSARPQQPTLCGSGRWGRTQGRQLCPSSVANRLQSGCPSAPTPLLTFTCCLAAKCEQYFDPKLTADAKFQAAVKSAHSPWDCICRPLMQCTFKIHSENYCAK